MGFSYSEGNAVCAPTERCRTCGFEESERERRKAYMKKHGYLGLEKCDDGLRRMVIRK